MTFRKKIVSNSPLYIERKLQQFQDSDLQMENDRLKKRLFRKEFEVTDLQMKIENQHQQIVTLKKELSKKEYEYKWLSDKWKDQKDLINCRDQEIKIKTREINDLRSRLCKEKEKWIEKGPGS